MKVLTPLTVCAPAKRFTLDDNAESDTLSAVAIVANLVSAIAASAFMSAFTIAPATIDPGLTPFTPTELAITSTPNVPAVIFVVTIALAVTPVKFEPSIAGKGPVSLSASMDTIETSLTALAAIDETITLEPKFPA